MAYYNIGATWGLGLPFSKFRAYDGIISDGQPIVPDIKVGETSNMRSSNGSWYCYRRNYIAVQCSYTLGSCTPKSKLHLESNNAEIYGFALSLSVCSAANRFDEPIKLVSFTGRREKGPVDQVGYWDLRPESISNMVESLELMRSKRDISPPFRMYDTTSELEMKVRPSYHRFERVQFKNATDNSPRRKVGLKSVSLSVDLYADIRKSNTDEPIWIKIASRVSDPVAVRGRSPTHYANK